MDERVDNLTEFSGLLIVNPTNLHLSYCCFFEYNETRLLAQS